MNKLLRKTLSLMLALVIAVAAAPMLVACRGNKTETVGDKSYVITLQRSSGDPIVKASVNVFDKDMRLVFRATTNENGQISFDAPAKTYSLQVSGLPDGYGEFRNLTVEAKNPKPIFKLNASVIQSELPNNYRYEIGSVLHDFSYTDTLNRSNTLSNILRTKKAVLLNFWFINCSWCGREFPDIAEAYSQYSDKVEVLAMNFMDTAQESEEYRQHGNPNYGTWDDPLPFPVLGKENTVCAKLATALGVSACPVSVLVDREGVVCFIDWDAGDKDEFTTLFERYTAEPYIQKIYFPGVSELDKPDIPNPASSEIENAINNKGSGFNFSYYFEEEDEYSWPWIVEGGDSIKASNSGHNNSYAVIHTDVTATSSQVLTFDYKTSTEGGGDFLYVLVNGVKCHTFSGTSTNWKTCYAYVPIKQNGVYTVTLMYIKDESQSAGDDTVYIKDMRFVAPNNVLERTEIIYRCATGERTNHAYAEYITPVYNETDGYYHVGTQDGPLVLADLMNPTAWRSESAWSYASLGDLKYDLNGDGKDEDYFIQFQSYSQYSNNSRRNGVIAVTSGLKQCLDALVNQYGNGGENEWLEVCEYIKVYGEDGEVGDPTEGMSDYTAYPIVVDDGSGNNKNHVNKETVLMPRGMWYTYTPTETAVYNIHSIGPNATYVWLATGPYETDIFAENDDPDNFSGPKEEMHNFNITAALHKDIKYYIRVDYEMVETLGEFDFLFTKVATSGKVWTEAAGGYVGILDEQGNLIGGELANAVEYVLNTTDNCYHVGSANGPLLYVDLGSGTSLFPGYSVSLMATMKCHYCKACGYKYQGSENAFKADTDPVCAACHAHGKNKFEELPMFKLPTAQRNVATGKVLTNVYQWEDELNPELPNIYVVPKYVLNGIGHSPENYNSEIERDGISFTDYTADMQRFVADSQNPANYPSDPNELCGSGPYKGYVPASALLVEILQKFIIFGDYSYSYDMDNTWLRMARYFQQLN